MLEASAVDLAHLVEALDARYREHVELDDLPTITITIDGRWG